jgi:TetR/AcrR family transcriptional regulator, transcriptional repressor for nem operon
MARPKEFDAEKALREAVRLFSRQGFAATSTEDLLQAMGISRQSMYDTFGDKRALFLKALDLYQRESVQVIIAELERSGSPLNALTGALITFAERKDMASPEGCMGLNAISEFGQTDADVVRLSHSSAQLLQKALLRVMQRARDAGELSTDTDLTTAVEFFMSTLSGIRFAAKAGKSRKALRSIAEFAGNAFRYSASPSLAS